MAYLAAASTKWPHLVDLKRLFAKYLQKNCSDFFLPKNNVSIYVLVVSMYNISRYFENASVPTTYVFF